MALPSRRPWPAARVEDGAVQTRHLGCHDEPRGPGTASREVRLRAQPPHVGIAPSRARGDFGVLLPLLLMARLALITLPVSGEGRLLRSVERVGGAAPAVDWNRRLDDGAADDEVDDGTDDETDEDDEDAKGTADEEHDDEAEDTDRSLLLLPRYDAGRRGAGEVSRECATVGRCSVTWSCAGLAVAVLAVAVASKAVLSEAVVASSPWRRRASSSSRGLAATTGRGAQPWWA